MKLAEVHQADFGTGRLPEAEAGQDFPLIIATMPATGRQRAIAVGIILLLTVAAAAIAPFASIQLPQVNAFIPVLQTVVSVADLVTATLLFAQFSIQPQRAVLVLRRELSSLLPLWEKVATGGLRPPFFNGTPMLCIGYAKSVPDEGSASAERDPSPVFAEFIIGRRFAPTSWRSHPLPQGRGKKRCTAKKRRCTASEILSNHAAAARFTVASASEVRLSSVFFSSCSV